MNETAEHESRFHDQGEHVDGPYPQQSENPLRSGTGKITDASGAPVYVFTEQVHTGAAWANGTAPGQYVGASARDIHGSTTGAVDGEIHFWEQYDQDGMVELVCEVGYHKAVAETPADPFTKDFWFHITGDMAWANVDTTHDYRNRIIDSFGAWGGGAPVDNGSWGEDDVEVIDTEAANWVAIDNAQGLARFVTKNTAIDYSLIHYHGFTNSAVVGDFEMQVAGATGYLQARSVNYQGVQYCFRVRLRCGNQLAATDDVDIPFS